jgi:hypothetical protein
MRCIPVVEDPASFFINGKDLDVRDAVVKGSRISQYESAATRRSPFAFGRNSDGSSLFSDESNSYRDSNMTEASQSLLAKWNDDGNV